MKLSQNIRIILFIWISILFFIIMTVTIKLFQERKKNQGVREDLPAKVSIAVEDESDYGSLPGYVLSGFVYYTYDEEGLTGKYRYKVSDGIGELTDWTVWQQDPDENIVREYTGVRYGEHNAIAGERLYEYDENMRVLRQLDYRENELREERFYTYREDNYVCICYSYGDRIITESGEDAGAVMTCIGSVYDYNGNELCSFYSDESGDLQHVIYREFDEKGRQTQERAEEGEDKITDLWTMQWKETAGDTDCLAGTCYYKPEDAEESVHSVYRSESDGEEVLWEVFIADNKLRYVRAFDYDENGNARTETEYALYDRRGKSTFRRMEYNETGQILEVYEYELTGDVVQACKDKGYVEFTLDEMSGIPRKITRVDENGKECWYCKFKRDGSFGGYRNQGYDGQGMKEIYGTEGEQEWQ